jgi:ketopantoate reductase
MEQIKLELISQTLDQAFIPNIVSSNINKIILEKLQFALAINVMSALLDKLNGEVFQSEANQNYVRYVVTFVANLANALNVENIRNYDAFKALNISESRYSSMHEDLYHGKMPEIKVIISAPLELSKYFNLTISTRPLEIVEELLFAKSNNIAVSDAQVQEIYHESNLALQYNEIAINIAGEGSDY